MTYKEEEKSIIDALEIISDCSCAFIHEQHGKTAKQIINDPALILLHDATQHLRMRHLELER